MPIMKTKPILSWVLRIPIYGYQQTALSDQNWPASHKMVFYGFCEYIDWRAARHCGHGYVSLRCGGNVIMRIGTQQQFCKYESFLSACASAQYDQSPPFCTYIRSNSHNRKYWPVRIRTDLFEGFQYAHDLKSLLCQIYKIVKLHERTDKTD